MHNVRSVSAHPYRSTRLFLLACYCLRVFNIISNHSSCLYLRRAVYDSWLDPTVAGKTQHPKKQVPDVGWFRVHTLGLLGSVCYSGVGCGCWHFLAWRLERHHIKTFEPVSRLLLTSRKSHTVANALPCVILASHVFSRASHDFWAPSSPQPHSSAALSL